MWANGNGGPNDDCAADGYASSPYTISVGAIRGDGRPSEYDEPCSAKLTVAPVTNGIMVNLPLNTQFYIFFCCFRETQLQSVTSFLMGQVQRHLWCLE